MSVKTIFFDLMDTLVYVDKKAVKKHLANIPTKKEETINWLKAGFMQALVAEELNVDYATLRDYLLTHDFHDLNEFISSGQRFTHSRLNEKTLHISKKLTLIARNNTHLFPETIEILEYLYSNGYNLYLYSNLMSPYKEIVKSLGLEKYFIKTIFSCEKGCKKPEGTLFQHYTFQKNKQAIMVGDNWHSDIIGAYQGDIPSIYIDRNNDNAFITHILNQGITGLIKLTSQNTIKIKEEFREYINEILPKSINQDNIASSLFKREDKVIQFKCLKDIYYATNLNEALTIIQNR